MMEKFWTYFVILLVLSIIARIIKAKLGGSSSNHRSRSNYHMHQHHHQQEMFRQMDNQAMEDAQRATDQAHRDTHNAHETMNNTNNFM